MSPLLEAAAPASTVRPSASSQVRKPRKQPCRSPSMITDRNARGYFPAPCQPRRVRSNLDCVTNSAWVSWDAAAGADGYFVSAVGGEGSTANCSTSSNTTCEVEDLVCGALYSITVVAKNSNCDSLSSETITLATGIRLVCDFMLKKLTKTTSYRLQFHQQACLFPSTLLPLWCHRCL